MFQFGDHQNKEIQSKSKASSISNVLGIFIGNRGMSVVGLCRVVKLSADMILVLDSVSAYGMVNRDNAQLLYNGNICDHSRAVHWAWWCVLWRGRGMLVLRVASHPPTSPQSINSFLNLQPQQCSYWFQLNTLPEYLHGFALH